MYPSTFCYTCSCIEPFIFPYIFSILLSVQSLVHPNNLFIHFSMSDRLTFDLYLYTDRSIYRLIDPTLLPLFSPSIHPTIHRSTVRPIHLSSHPSTHPFLCSAMMKSEQEADSDGVYRAVWHGLRVKENLENWCPDCVLCSKWRTIEDELPDLNSV